MKYKQKLKLYLSSFEQMYKTNIVMYIITFHNL